MTTVVVAGAVANKPGNAGEAWVRMTWLRGLLALGCSVRFLEAIDERVCRDPSGRPCALQDSVNRAWFDAVVSAFDLHGAAALMCGDDVHGARTSDVFRWADEADLLIDISGHVASMEQASAVFTRFANTLYVDLDPAYTQVWHTETASRPQLHQHAHHATVGLLVGRSQCLVPDVGIEWMPVPPFVVLDDWPRMPAPVRPAFTTVSTWRNPFGPLVIGDRCLPGKHHAFRRFRDLPALVPTTMEVAIDFDEDDAADRIALQDCGWSIVSPRDVAGTAQAFRDYVHASAGEWSVAQGPYVDLRTGWISDRTVRYLASGRPAVVEDTGIGDVLPVGEGLLVFDDLEGAADAVREVHDDWDRHSATARDLAVSTFSSDVVLPPLLTACGVGA